MFAVLWCTLHIMCVCYILISGHQSRLLDSLGFVDWGVNALTALRQKRSNIHPINQLKQAPRPAARFTAVPTLPSWRFDGACKPAVNRHHKVNIKTHALPTACFVYVRLTGRAWCLFCAVTRGLFSFTALSVRGRRILGISRMEITPEEHFRERSIV